MKSHVSARTGVCCIFGDPIEHSFSPALHNKAFIEAGLDYVYIASTVNESTIKDAIQAVRTLGFRGGSLTMPNKIACLPYLDEIDPVAKAVGAVNTLVNDDGCITGYNTDGYGCLKSFEVMGVSAQGKKMVLLGLGGAGGSVAATAAINYGLGELVVFNRAGGKSWPHAEHVLARIKDHSDCKMRLLDLNDKELLRKEMATADLLVNTTNVGMASLEGQSVVPDASFFHPDMVVHDAIYSPAKTQLLMLAEQAGCVYTNGLPMLFYQATKQFELWTGQKMPLTVDDLRAMM